MPSFGMYTAEGTLVKWLEPPGAEVAEGSPILEIETDKATHEVMAPAAGRLHPIAAEGAHVTEQQLLGFILADGEPAPELEPEPTMRPEPAPQRSTPSPRPAAATPIARRLAAQHGLDLKRLRGSGPGGRIVEADVVAAAAAARPAPGRSLSGERVPLSPARRTIARRLRWSFAEAIPCTLTREVDADRLVALRKKLRAGADEQLPYEAFFARFLAVELREHEELNVALEGDQLVRLEHVHVAFAVDVPTGVVAPVLRDPDTRSLASIARAVRELAERARLGLLRAEELEGASSTISNLGGHGVDAFTPVLNPPQASILGVGRIRSVATLSGTTLVPARRVVLSLTFDHRVADGATAARLLAGIDSRMNDESFLATLD